MEEDVISDRLIRRFGWTARVVRNEEDVGWAVEMTRAGDDAPALVGPWTMGRDKKNPKPLDMAAFHTLIKTANDVLSRHEQAGRDALRKTLLVRLADGRSIRAKLDIVPDEDDPRGQLSCVDEATGEVVREGRVSAGFRFDAARVAAFVLDGE